HGERRLIDAPHCTVRRHDDVRREKLLVLLYEGVEMAAADLLLPLEHELHVDGQAAGRREKRLSNRDRNEHGPLVVGHASGVEAAIAHGWRPRRTVPLLERIGWLHIVVAVHKECRLAWCGQPLAVHDRIAGGGKTAHCERP